MGRWGYVAQDGGAKIRQQKAEREAARVAKARHEVRALCVFAESAGVLPAVCVFVYVHSLGVTWMCWKPSSPVSLFFFGGVAHGCGLEWGAWVGRMGGAHGWRDKSIHGSGLESWIGLDWFGLVWYGNVHSVCFVLASLSSGCCRPSFVKPVGSR